MHVYLHLSSCTSREKIHSFLKENYAHFFITLPQSQLWQTARVNPSIIHYSVLCTHIVKKLVYLKFSSTAHCQNRSWQREGKNAYLCLTWHLTPHIFVFQKYIFCKLMFLEATDVTVWHRCFICLFGWF